MMNLRARRLALPLTAGLVLAACAAEPDSGSGEANDTEVKPNPQGLVGAIPDFAPLQGVRIHSLALDIAGSFATTLASVGIGVERTALGCTPSGCEDTSLVWMRDYAPIYVGPEAGGLEVFSYLSINPARSDFTASTSVPVAPPTPGTELYRPIGQSIGGRWLPTETLPIVHENGNLVSSGSYLFLTDKIFADNAAPHTEAHLTSAGYRTRSSDEVLDILANATGVARDHIVVLPPMPGEKTHHVDLYVMALSATELLLPEIRDEQLALLTYEHEIALGWEVHDFLDVQAAALAGLGLRISRLPMLAPVFLTEASEPGRWNGVFYSPTNGLLVQAGEIAAALLPTFDPVGFPEAYRSLSTQYVAEWVSFFEGRGYDAITIDASSLGHTYGLFRCLSAVTPL